MTENMTKEELMQQLADKGIEFEISDEMLEAVAGGAGGRPDMKALAESMKTKLVGAKQNGISKEQYLSVYGNFMQEALAQYGEGSNKYLVAQEHYKFIQENWDIL